MYNYYRESWLVDRFAGSLDDVYGHAPCMTTFKRNAAVLVAGTTPADQSRAKTWQPSGAVPAAASDDHPFPYLLHRSIRTLYLGALGAILLVTLLSVCLTGVRIRSTLRYTDMFLLGAAFILLETKNVLGFALYFGTTWLVNALVFFGVLVAVLAAVKVRRRLRKVDRPMLQLLLFGSLAVVWLVPASAVLSLPFAARLAAAIALAFTPIFCADLIFSDRLALAPDPTAALGANLLGAMAGGVTEYLALVTGYQALLLVVAALCLGAFAAMRFAGRKPAVTDEERALEVTSWALGLLADLPRMNRRTIAEHIGDATPDRLQHLLGRARWDAGPVRDDDSPKWGPSENRRSAPRGRQDSAQAARGASPGPAV